MIFVVCWVCLVLLRCHFLRIIASVRRFVHEVSFDEYLAPPPDADVLCSQELRDYLWANWNQEAAQRARTQSMPTSPHEPLTFKAIDSFLAVFNGGFHSMQLRHYCSGRNCCANRQATEDRMVHRCKNSQEHGRTRRCEVLVITAMRLVCRGHSPCASRQTQTQHIGLGPAC